MPTSYIKKLSSEGHGSIQALEKKWDEAKSQAKKSGQGDNFAYVTTIFKKMVHKASLERSSWSEATTLPPEPGTQPIPAGTVRLYHQTAEESIASIMRSGLDIEHAKGIEGPRAIYASETGFYGKPTDRPTIEFYVPKDKWDNPFVLEDVPPSHILAAHLPWHKLARYLEDNPKSLARSLAGEFDDLKGDYAKAVAYIKHKHGGRVEHAATDPTIPGASHQPTMQTHKLVTRDAVSAKKQALVIGFLWDKYTPRVESQIILDCMKLQGANPNARVYAYIDKELVSREEMALAKRFLLKADVKTISSMPPNPDWVQAFKVYYHDMDMKPAIPEPLMMGGCKIFEQCMVPKVKMIRLRPGVTHYPHFRDVERIAPPGTLPQYKARPPSNTPALYTLPLWAR